MPRLVARSAFAQHPPPAAVAGQTGKGIVAAAAAAAMVASGVAAPADAAQRSCAAGRSTGDRSLAVQVAGAAPGGRRTRWDFFAQRREGQPALALRGSALRPSGAAAFLAGPITDPASVTSPPRFEVHASTPRGEKRLLDAGARHRPRLLRRGRKPDLLGPRRGDQGRPAGRDAPYGATCATGAVRTARWP